jgi:hypothetical protein
MNNEIVIARYNEDLEWIADIPHEFTVIIYNKGPAITSRRVIARAGKVLTLANSGRESDTILRHILGKTDSGDGFTVFLQGDPFEHSPDIIALLRNWRRWDDLQPLSWQWVAATKLPPPEILSSETATFIEGARVRAELFSLSTWGQLQFFDAGAKVMGDWYRHIHNLPDGINIAAHFLRRCEWPELAEQAERHLVGNFAYGALFAVRQQRLPESRRRSLEYALEAANAHKVYGYILERLWLHICGEPFLLACRNIISREEDVSSMTPRFVPPPPKPPQHLRIVPAIKRRISNWARD